VEKRLMESPVLFERVALANGGEMGRITLNALATLNSLSLEMIDLIQAQRRCHQSTGF
jgi:enoyl-CoA hydratase/carnithine racemase